MVNKEKLSEWCWLSDKNVYYAFTRMLFKANYENRQWRDIIVGRGQFVCGIESYAAELGFSTQSFRTILKNLKKTGDIELKSTNKYTVVTVCNYDSWVCFNGANNIETNKQTNNQLTNEQQTTNNNIIIEELNKQIEELKKELANASKKKERSSVFVKPTVEEVAAYILEKGYHFDAERFHSYYESNGWMVGKSKMKDWKAACKTWENKWKDQNPTLATQAKQITNENGEVMVIHPDWKYVGEDGNHYETMYDMSRRQNSYEEYFKLYGNYVDPK